MTGRTSNRRFTAPRSRRAAFTLVELLVVVAIIALLIAILLPSLNKAKEAGRGVVCGSNQRQIYMGWELYIQDHNGTQVPMDKRFPTVAWKTGFWAHMLLGADGSATSSGSTVTIGKNTNYLGSAGVLLCPSGSNTLKLTCWGVNEGSVPNMYYKGKQAENSYGYLGFTMVAATGHYTTTDWSIWVTDVKRFYSQRLKHTSIWPVFIDADCPRIQRTLDAWRYPGDPIASQSSSALNSGARARHLGAANTLFADGHVGTIQGGTPDYNGDFIKLGLSPISGAAP